MSYWVLFSAFKSDGAVLSSIPSPGPKGYEYRHGKILGDKFPAHDDAVMLFDSQYSEGIKLYDFIYTIDSVLVVNGKVKSILDDIGAEDLEYLPITVWDHQRNIASEDFFILNPIGGVEFIDMEESDFEFNPLNESQIVSIEELVVRDVDIPVGKKLFRASTKMDQIFISDEVKTAFEKAGVEGYKVFEAEGWDGLDV